MKEAMFWEAGEEGSVRCGLCHHRCSIKPGRRGICAVRENREGKLVSLVYGHPTSSAVDPIEKKPLNHFLPGSDTFSIATRGCNFQCLHCQNCSISQVHAGEPVDRDRYVGPPLIVQSARRLGCRSISYTYTEPTVFFEYAYDTARLASASGLKNVFVTNGYITPEPLREIGPYLDAANIDLKFFSDELYRKVCGARLQPVLDTIRLYHELHIWIEVATLVIPGYNDSEDQLRGMAEFLAALDVRIPWHVTGFHPAYRLTEPPSTALETLQRAREIGFDAGLQYVYTGNMADDEGSTTRCPGCGAAVIRRPLARGLPTGRTDGHCPKCGRTVAGVWA